MGVFERRLTAVMGRRKALNDLAKITLQGYYKGRITR